jgi:hypothetical protein
MIWNAGEAFVETIVSKYAPAVLAVVALLVAPPAIAHQTSATPGPATAELPAVRHLVYRFGYNTKATKEGTGTGTTTIDIVGLASDGGMTINATDNWWNTVRPRQTYTCEVYANGGVNCPQRPNALSPIQIAVVPLLGRAYFSALSAAPTSTWKQNYKVTATFFPSATSGFAGQLYTWNCAYTLEGKGTSGSSPLILIHSDGSMKQQGGRYITVNQKANLLYDPRIKMPVFIDESITFVPQLSVNKYTIQLKLIRD